ncbi:MAG TPA: indole-3-glycerol phosphate synthase TrpC [Actinomycetota bacterium]|nr:indole-3-glycerol phosphate synthase TrpC [Actinomycetota bacterium]
MGFLSDLVERLRTELREHPPDESRLLARARAMPPPRPFEAALRERHPSPALIAEVKRASPSAGEIRADADPRALALAYVAAGAAAISVLTEPRHFQGSLSDLRAVRSSVAVPVLRKDFHVHPAQLIEARAAGADAVLVIAAAVSDDELTALLATATDLGLDVLLEAHGDEDLDRALATDTPVVGVNARDLETLEVDVPAALERIRRVPGDRVAVLESGIAGRADVDAAVLAGASAILVGESLMRADDPARAVRKLLWRELRT